MRRQWRRISSAISISIRPEHFPRIFVDAAATVTDARLWALALTAMVYAAVRFAEAYGLWRQRAWAEWFAILTGSLYLPVELYELTVSVTAVKVAVFLGQPLHRRLAFQGALAGAGQGVRRADLPAVLPRIRSTSRSAVSPVGTSGGVSREDEQ